MAYRWKPNASQRREFAERMKNPEEQTAYLERKKIKNSYVGFKDKFFVPTKMQYDFAMSILSNGLSEMSHVTANACNFIISAWVCQDKVHHDYIHVINSIQRGDKTPMDVIFE